MGIVLPSRMDVEHLPETLDLAWVKVTGQEMGLGLLGEHLPSKERPWPRSTQLVRAEHSLSDVLALKVA